MRRMRKAIGTAVAGSTLAAAAIVAAPTASASHHTITSVVYWTGVNCITVRSPQYPNGNYTGLDRICGGNSTVTYEAVSGEYIGADPMPFDQTRTVGCSVSSTGRSATATMRATGITTTSTACGRCPTTITPTGCREGRSEKS